MESNSWVEKYQTLNNSYDKTLVFRVGIQAGFFSELNHMFLAVLFCLKNNIRFVLSSRDNNFAFDKGWQDYFLPFCEESNSKIHLKYNARSYQIKNTISNLVRAKLIRSFLKIDYLTQDVWTFIRDAKFQNETFDIPELEIKGNLINTLQVVLNHIWRYQPEVQNEIDAKISTLNLPSTYAGLHVRAGDKATEAKLSPAQEYIDYLTSLSPIKDLFVLTDDYQVIKEFKEDFSAYRIYTFCEENEKGFSEGAYNNLSKDDKRSMIIKLLANTEVLYKSSVFVGTMSSNVGIFIGMRRNAKAWYGVDANDWRMW